MSKPAAAFQLYLNSEAFTDLTVLRAPAGALQPDLCPTHIHMSFTVSSGGEVGQARGATAEPSWLLISLLPAWTLWRMDCSRAMGRWCGRGLQAGLGDNWPETEREQSAEGTWDDAETQLLKQTAWAPLSTPLARNKRRRPRPCLLSPLPAGSEAGRQVGVSVYSLSHTHSLRDELLRCFKEK